MDEAAIANMDKVNFIMNYKPSPFVPPFSFYPLLLYFWNEKKEEENMKIL